MSGLNVKIDKFMGINSFSLWQIKMQALLKQQGMWAPLVKKSGDPEIAEMASLEEKAHSTILLCLADDIITEVAEEETAAGLWLKLESLYMTKSLTNKLLLKRRLFSLRMEEGTTLRDHLDQLNTILLELRNIDVKVDDEDAALILLVSLPLLYENFVDSFIGGRDTVTLEEVRSSLHTREMRHKATGTSSDSQAAGLVASGSMGQESSGKKKFKKPVSKGSKSNDVCNYCKEQGHWKNECPKKKKQHVVHLVHLALLWCIWYIWHYCGASGTSGINVVHLKLGRLKKTPIPLSLSNYGGRGGDVADEKWRVEDKMLDWGGRDDAKLLIPATVLLLYMFNVAEMKADERLRRELQADVEEECQKLGPVDSVKVCENHPQGVVLVRLKDRKDAQKCIELMNGRWFGFLPDAHVPVVHRIGSPMYT
ncbi:hypothetical protein ACLB2K_030803 [Fragaria x ananassa]